jgi:HSP20 family protein
MSRRTPATCKSPNCSTSPFTSFEKHVGDIMSSVFGGSPVASYPDGSVGLAAFSPCIDLVENESSVTLTAELPGVEEKDIELTITPDSLVLRGEKKAEERDEKDDVYRVERSFGSFERTFTLSSDVLADDAKATFSSGVLKVVLPKADPKATHKRIEIESS